MCVMGDLTPIFSCNVRAEPDFFFCYRPYKVAIIPILAIIEMSDEMIKITSVEAQNRFGELIDKSLREPVEITRRGRTVAYVVSGEDMRELMEVRKRREEAVRWYSHYRDQVISQPLSGDLPDLTDADVNELVHELR